MNGTRNALLNGLGEKTKKIVSKILENFAGTWKETLFSVRSKCGQRSDSTQWLHCVPLGSHPPPNLQLANCSTFLALDRWHLNLKSYNCKVLYLYRLALPFGNLKASPVCIKVMLSLKRVYCVSLGIHHRGLIFLIKLKVFPHLSGNSKCIPK